MRATLKRENAAMKLFSAKSALSALGIIVMLASPAFAKKAHQVSRAAESADYNSIPSYDKDGGVVGIPDPDQSAQSQR
jgi:hypothetical protein